MKAVQHVADDQAMKWQNNPQVNTPQQIVRLDHRRCGDLLAAFDIDNDAKIQMTVVKARDQPLGGFAQHRKQADDPAAGRFILA
jgi:hypothetical protein